MLDLSFDARLELIAPEDETTEESVILIGTSSNGPNLSMTRAFSHRDAINMFGSGELVRGAYEALGAGASRVYLIKIGGKEAETNLRDSGGNIVAKAQSFFAGDDYNNIKIEVKDNDLTIYYEGDDNKRKLVSYNLYGKTYGDLREETIENLYKGISPILIEPYEKFVSLVDLRSTEKSLSGGASNEDMNIDERYEYLEEALEHIRSIDIPGIVVPISCHIDKKPEILRLVNDYCSVRNKEGVGTISVLPVSSPSDDITTGHNYVTAIAGEATFRISDINPDALDLNDNNVLSYVNTCESVCAGFINSLRFSESPANKTIQGIINYEISDDFDKDKLEEVGISYIIQTIRKGLVLKDSLSLSSRQAFRPIESIRTVTHIRDAIRRMLDGNIGSPVIEAMDASMKVDEYLAYLKSNNDIRDYTFNIRPRGLHQLVIEMEIIPINTIKLVQTNLSVGVRWDS